MNLKPFRSAIMVLGGSAAIIVAGVLAIRSQPGRGENVNASLELIRGECNRESIIAPQYRSSATRVRNLLNSGSIDRWRDIAFRSGENNEGIYLPHPNPKLNDAGVRINVVEVHLSDGKAFEMRIPVVQVKGSAIGLSSPRYRYYSCLYLFKNDFVDYF